jgi:hypothetical protein
MWLGKPQTPAGRSLHPLKIPSFSLVPQEAEREKKKHLGKPQAQAGRTLHSLELRLLKLLFVANASSMF